jgi:hypothetical protein
MTAPSDCSGLSIQHYITEKLVGSQVRSLLLEIFFNYSCRIINDPFAILLLAN